jgi:hypothetical protein
VRPAALNLGTAVLTLVLLGTLSFPAGRILTAPLHSAAEPARADAAPAPGPFFGEYGNPWHLAGWQRAMGARPRLLAKFQSFSQSHPIGGFLAQCERDGIGSVLISWEPWRPLPASLGGRAQGSPQFGYRNVDIAAGAQDAYIRGFARSLRGFSGTVYLRYAHEMNGFWYPWSRNARAYVLAWRRVVRIFRSEGARNVRFVWSVNPSLYLYRSQWRRRIGRYWPGDSYVDDVGSTMIDFGGVKRYTVARFRPALGELRRIFHKPLILTEVNTEFRGRVAWLRQFELVLRRRPWISGVVWSQLPSRSKAQAGPKVGNLSWDVTRDPPAAAVVRQIIEDRSG